MAADYVNPTYDDIMDCNGEKSSYESLQKENIRRALPVTPAESSTEYQEVTLSSKDQDVADSTQTKVLLKRYLAAVIVLSVLCVLLVLAVILVYIFIGRTCSCQTIHHQEQKLEGCTTEWKTLEGQSYPGGLELIVSSVEVCQSVCEGMYSCKALDYSLSQGICWLHTQSSELEDKQRDATKTQYILITRCVLQDNHSETYPQLNDTSTMTTTVTPTVLQSSTTMIQRFPKDCQSYKESGITRSGVYPIQLISHPAIDVVDVYCDMVLDGGGWTTLLKREDGSVPFENRPWADYKYGFGDVSGEHWIGNDFMNELTLNNGDLYELRFDLEDFDGEKRFAKYQHFAVANETAKYTLFLGSYSGNAGDSFARVPNMEFSTIDNDNDIYSGNCAVMYTGGWWYGHCHISMLTGIYGSTAYANGVNWVRWKGHYKSLKYADMKVRPSSIVRNSCKALKESGISYNDVHTISLNIGAIQPINSIQVSCDQTTQGGGWMLILRRNDVENIDFNRNWSEYQAGFGQVRGEFWFGLDTLHKMTSTAMIYELYVELKTSSNDQKYIIYSSFKVTAESDDYRLILGPVKEGDLVDSLQDNNGQPFSTRDADNDNWEQNCAQANAGGWWYNSCTEALLTGRDDPGSPVEQRLRWKNWLGTREEFPPIAEATMMIRPVD